MAQYLTRDNYGETIGILESIVIDCPDPHALARFYTELLGAKIVGHDADWAEVLRPQPVGTDS